MIRKNIFIVITVFLITVIISACASDNQNNSTDDRADDKVAKEENNSNNNDIEKSEDGSEETKDPNEISEDEAIEKVKDYVEGHEDYDPNNYEFGVEEKEGKYAISIFPKIPDDDQRGAQIIGSFEVDKVTGEIKEFDDNIGEKEVSEIVEMDKDEQRAHHEQLAVEPENTKDEVYEHLLLPGIHENTSKYQGRINPGEKVKFEFPDAKNIANRSTFEPEVSENGFFTIKMNAYEFKEGQDIRVYITNGYPHEQTFDLPVHKDKEGMEDIRVKK